MNNQENSVPDAEIENMTFSYSSLPVIDHMNFILNSGDYVILTGENGCGKSTFLKLLLGELIPRQGKIYLFGQTVSPAVFRRFYIGYVPRTVSAKTRISRQQSGKSCGPDFMENHTIRENADSQKKKSVLLYQNLKCRIISADRLANFPEGSSRESCLHVL